MWTLWEELPKDHTEARDGQLQLYTKNILFLQEFRKQKTIYPQLKCRSKAQSVGAKCPGPMRYHNNSGKVSTMCIQGTDR